ncbi:CHAD domain-containing protein [Ktedonobacter robiniae]|uniref:CHAD domain-containing protein n=1 Tax=Ktedonobacter robiniae TaxID=2778365 RepID=A0ABQ3UIA1_9CHLR|nr:CHAD domain-containing protein [Ktedonobacter robiniae]GHO52451.1 hypothetical protein KSB_09260 [Ktedonobacter robiniae]
MQETRTAPARAAIDIGSNTLQLLIARCQGDSLDILVDEEEMVRLGKDVNAHGEISPQKREEVIDILQRYKALAVEHQVESIFVVATEATRKARNSQQFLNAIERAVGVKTQVIGGEVEAMLTFYGASYEYYRQQGAPDPLVVMDLGGGSTELINAQRGKVKWLTSVPVGSGWLHDRYMPSDPPTEDERDLAQVFLKAYMDGTRLKSRPEALIITGGSAKALLKMARAALELGDEVQRLSFMDVVRCDGLLSSLTAGEVARRYGIDEKRAAVLPAGATIIQAVMTRLQLCEVRISTHGIREGVLLAYARHGDDWLATLESHGESAGSKKSTSTGAEMVTETFAETGRRLLSEGARKMGEWRAEVLKNEDVEAVHKMRVASRRLRAVLDAYEDICEPKAFKKVYSWTRELADMLGQARDTDVMIQNLQQREEEAEAEEKEGLNWFIARLRVYRDEHQLALARYLKKLDEQKLLRLIDACLPKEGKRHG